MKRQIFVIGGGPAGMMAAITAAREGACVTILEHNDRIGKKILSTGNGRCNFTNVNQSSKYYRGDNKGFAWKAIQHFSFDDTLAFFEELEFMRRIKMEDYIHFPNRQALFWMCFAWKSTV